jgi:quercetin dioxygenase-like cupin family protein
MTEPSSDDSRSLQALLDREAAVDALHRFAAGQDRRDRGLFLSAFAPDAQLDFTHPATRFGAEVPVMAGRDVIAGIIDTLEPLQTSHTVTNARVRVEGDRAELSCLVEAQHVRRDDPRRHLLLKNTYDVTLVRDGSAFVIDTMTIRNLWSHGDPSVLFAASPDAVVHQRGAGAGWIDQGSGVQLRPLRVVGEAAGTALLRFAPGGRSPAHRHPGGEDLYVVDGRLRVGDRELEAGDFLYTPPGLAHDAESTDGALVLVTVPEPIEMLESA